MVDDKKNFISYYHSPIGILEINVSRHAINRLCFVESKKESTERPPKIMNDCLFQLDEYFNGSRKIFTINVEQTGTDFQKLVWKKLENIPYGKTVSYLDIAKKTGNAKNVRAVGNANGKNKIAIIIPCHRVIGTNENLIGYASGLWRKQWLLEHERNVNYGILKLF